jgi:hypothetical protein
MIIIRSNENNPNYKNFKNSLNDDMKNKLMSMDVNIFEDKLQEGSNDGFHVYIYNNEGAMLTKLNNFTSMDNLISDLQLEDKSMNGGGSNELDIYKRKYMKYKKKYETLKKISVLFNK